MILLKELRQVTCKGSKGGKLVGKVFIQPDALILSLKARGGEEPVLFDLVEVIAGYVNPAVVEVMKKICARVYQNANK